MEIRIKIFLLLFLLLPSRVLRSETTSNLFLRAIVQPSIVTNFNESKINETQSLWLFSSKMNSRYYGEGQKFEVEGLDQAGLQSHIKHTVGIDRSIQFEILINRLNASTSILKPIFLKISAN
jgi:hypothetical protein